jgi:hypothetical protein
VEIVRRGIEAFNGGGPTGLRRLPQSRSSDPCLPQNCGHPMVSAMADCLPRVRVPKKRQVPRRRRVKEQ